VYISRQGGARKLVYHPAAATVNGTLDLGPGKPGHFFVDVQDMLSYCVGTHRAEGPIEGESNHG